ncbi:hypothetical protein E4L96_15965 [Massilia arenosa]|uniref:Uncharacterized protein n=1 Tax=Zemynaea arenosa TaxID=2561931 RepID=A0A4Y9SA86_9BURK|nr:hypothetical protein [Massilia arenosa]TFW16640.1 hypothetical protein E4L96_15965 [Massilia arenosa]
MYVASLLFSCQLIPAGIRKAISAWRLDRHDAPFGTLFRFHHAPWYYLLTGADFKAGEKPDMVRVSAIVEVGKEPILYVGGLDDFFFAADGQLDRIVLQQVVRRPLSSDKPAAVSHCGNAEEAESGRFYPIDGDYLVIRYSDVKTLNVQFIKLTSSPMTTEA